MASRHHEPLKFYCLEQPTPGTPEDREGGFDALPEEGFNTGEAPKCPRCGRFLGMLAWLPPYRMELITWGRRYGDIARTGDDLIVSDRFADVFLNHGLRGLPCIEPVEVVTLVHRRGKPIEPPPRYFKATVVRSATTIDQEASGYVWKDASKICPECLFDTLVRFDRLVVNEGTWTGDDIFFPRGGNGPIVSERFRATFEENGLIGAAFNPVEEETCDNTAWI